jgi:hypothetical protein
VPRRDGLTPGFLRARESRAGRTTCDYDQKGGLSCGVGRPPVSAVVRDLPVGCGPDVAPGSRAWKALSRARLGRAPTPNWEVRDDLHEPLVTARVPFARARRGHGWVRPGPLSGGRCARAGLGAGAAQPGRPPGRRPAGRVCSTGCALRLVSAAHAAAPSFSPGAARSGIARGPVPSRPVIPGPAHLPWEGRSTAHALDLERANAAPDRSAEIRSVDGGSSDHIR